MNKQEKEVWMKILGKRMRSFTDNSKEYIIFADEKGLTCSCMDFKIRGGSYFIIFKDPEQPEMLQGNHTQGCKHIAQELANIGMKNVIRKDRYGHQEKIEPQENP